ncbi:COG4 transport protein-domain-containing protein [Zopfochytrium polystomum]|nr:COG4 transport protein-domain-containing protein [Zopfochytrium polystomum]
MPAATATTGTPGMAAPLPTGDLAVVGDVGDVAGAASWQEQQQQPPQAVKEPQKSLPMDRLRRLTDIAEVQLQLRLIADEEATLDAELDNLVGVKVGQLEREMEMLEGLRPRIGKMSAEGESLQRVITTTSLLSERISDHVRQLDLQQSRVKQTLLLISDIQTLRDSAAGATEALAQGDLETAAIHVSSYLQLPLALLEEVLNLPSGAAADGSPGLDDESPLRPLQVLSQARADMAQTVAQLFETAVKAGDEAGVVRAAILFPQIGESAEGLDRFAGFVGGVIARMGKEGMRAVSSTDAVGPTAYAELMTRLFENVAGLIDRQEPFIESRYGVGRFLRVMEKLLAVTDVQGLLILDTFSDARALDRKIADITALQSALAQGRPVPPVVQVESREVDGVISELAIISQRTKLFQRFIELRAEAQQEKIAELEDGKAPPELNGVVVDFARTQLFVRARELMNNFIILNEFFIKKSIEKAIKLDQRDQGSQTSSVVDDTFYILKSSLSRGLSTSDPLSVCSLLELVAKVLDTEYIAWFQKRLSREFSAMSGPVGDARDSRLAFMISLNNVDVSCDYIKKLVHDVEAEIPMHMPAASEKDMDKMRTCLTSITELGTGFKKILMTWVETLFTHAIKPRIRTILQESHRDVKYVMSENEYMELDATEPVSRRFSVAFGKMIAYYKKSLTERNYDQSMSHAIEVITREWEQLVLQSLRFNQLGALRFDKDVRAISGYVASQTQWTSRDRFVRLSQMAQVLNLERVGEIHEIWTGGGGGGAAAGMGWRLSAGEVRRVLGLRSDFKSDEIAALKLQ